MSDDLLSSDDAWLWDRTGPPDPEVERLEALLAPLAHAGVAPAAPGLARGIRPRMRWAHAAAAAIAVAVTAGWLGLPGPREGPPTSAIAVVADGGPPLAAGAWVEASGSPREVRFGDLGRVTLQPGSRLRVAEAKEEVTRFFLERGGLEAFVSADARPRFFQVDTAAARCVDLGCRYTLEVAADGAARVRVLTGQVAFETPTRQVYVPAGAVCEARPASGPGTPRFEGASEALTAAISRYDGAPAGSAERRAAAADLLAAVASAEDALPAWHLLADRDPATASSAIATLTTRFGPPDGWSRREGAPTPDDLAAWRDHLDAMW